ncbi:hypothetical protein [Escherichia coli]|uniref:hypothetical protein n=1 Tax=Escherichia coli TaxID=562 RepID=UPI00157B6758|nr:hypothetical protein [Escherichia coli]
MLKTNAFDNVFVRVAVEIDSGWPSVRHVRFEGNTHTAMRKENGSGTLTLRRHKWYARRLLSCAGKAKFGWRRGVGLHGATPVIQTR